MKEGVVVIINDIGIPILVRTYGLAQIPSNAAIGVINALFHAGLNVQTSLNYVESELYRITYRHSTDGLLMVLFESTIISSQKSLKTLEFMDYLINLVLSEKILTSIDSNIQKFELSKHIPLIDAFIRRRNEMEFTVKMPLTTSYPLVSCDFLGFPWKGSQYLVQDGIIIGETETLTIDCHHAVLILTISQLIHEHTQKTYMHYLIYINRAPSHVHAIKLPSSSSQNLIWIGITFDDSLMDHKYIQEKLQIWHNTMHPSIVPSWTLHVSISKLCKTLLGFCAFRQSPSSGCRAIVGMRSTKELMNIIPPEKKNSPRSQHQLYTLLCHWIGQWNPPNELYDHTLTISDIQLVYAVRPPMQLIYVHTDEFPCQDTWRLSDTIISIVGTF